MSDKQPEGGRGGPGGPSSVSPVTEEELVRDVKSNSRLAFGAQNALDYIERVRQSGGTPEVRFSSSSGHYSGRAGPDDEWEPIL